MKLRNVIMMDLMYLVPVMIMIMIPANIHMAAAPNATFLRIMVVIAS